MHHRRVFEVGNDLRIRVVDPPFEPFVDELRKARTGLLVHAANSAATYRDGRAHFDMVRCGIAIYGLRVGKSLPSGSALGKNLSFAVV